MLLVTRPLQAGLTCTLFWETLAVFFLREDQISPKLLMESHKATFPSYILRAIWGHLLMLGSCSTFPKSKELVALLQWDAELPRTTLWLQPSAKAGQMLYRRLNCAKCARGRDKRPPEDSSFAQQ